MDVSTPGSGEALIDAFSKPIVDDANPKLILGYAPIRGLIRFNEFTDLTTRANRQGSSLKPTLMSFYDTAGTITTRSRLHGDVRADHHYGQVVSTTQPKAIREHVERMDVDSGFVNRWIFAKAVEKERVVLADNDLDYTRATRMLRELRGWCSPRLVRLADEGLAKFHEVITTSVFTNMDQESAIFDRLDLTFKKVLLLLAINERMQTIDEEDLVVRAAKLIEYLIHTYEVTDRSIGFGPFEDCCDAVVSAIETLTASGKHPTVAEIRRMLPKRFNAELMTRAMKSLIQVGVISEMESVKGITRYTMTA